MLNRSLFLALVLSLATAATARAATVTGFVGQYLYSNQALMAGGELTFRVLPELDLGGFYEHSSEDDNAQTLADSRNFYGVVGRLHIPVVSLFVDTRMG